MKKFITLFLSFVLMLALAVPAAAYDGTEVETGETPENWDGEVKVPDDLDPGFLVDSDEVDEAQWQERLDAAITEAGGVPGRVNVMLNGKCVEFPYGVPEITDGGRTMVPMRAILEALGAEVTYDNDTRTAQAVLGKLTITHVIGSDVIDLSDGGQLTMDTVSYIKDGSTLVPVRFFSQALGFEVYWDDVYKTAVVVDKDVLIQEIDSSLTIVNDLLAQAGDEMTGNQLLSMNLEAAIQPAGSDEMPLSLEMTALYNESAANISGTANVSALPVLLEMLGQEVPALAQTVLQNDLAFEGIFSDATIWVTVPALKEMIGDVWFRTTEAELFGDIGDVFEIDASADMTMGSLLYDLVETADVETPFNLYADLAETTALITEMLGDDTFTKDGGTYTWSLTLPEILWTTGSDSPISIDMTIAEDGTTTYTLGFEYEDMVTASVKGTSSTTEETMEGEIHIQDVCDMTFQMNASLQASEEAPVSAPPASAQIMPLPLS